MKKMFLSLMTLLITNHFFAQTYKIPTSDGETLYVTVKGKGKPCLYLHGGPGSGSWWLEKFMGDELEQKFTMIYLDQRGVARSSGTEESDYSMERLVKDFEEVREYMGIETWHTLSHSFGGLFQMGYALKHPEVIEGMIMINAALNMQECFETSWCPKALEFAGMDNNAICTESDTHFVVRWHKVIQLVQEKNVFWKMGYTKEENMQIMNASFNEIPNWNWQFGNKAMDVLDYHKNFKPYTSQLQMPVLFFYGLTDWMIGPKHYRGVNFPNMLIWPSEVGHMPFMEDKENLMKAIITFLEKYY
jgi:proline iminopeptidase